MTFTGPALIVPVDVAALRVSDAMSTHGTFSQVATKFDRLPYRDPVHGFQDPHNLPNLSEFANPAAFDLASQPPRGIHVHWALPDALTRGATDGGPVTFPQAPNRWLIVRIVSSDGPTAPVPTVRAWVVESDSVWDNDGTDPLVANNVRCLVPQLTSGQQRRLADDPTPQFTYYRQLGRTHAHESWNPAKTANDLRFDNFTALGHGRPTFAAGYQESRGVFGLYDDAHDIDLGVFPPSSSSVTYSVIGWHAEDTADPLFGATTPADVAARCAALRWSYDSKITPTRTVYGGALVGVSWDPGASVDHGASGADLTVAVGNTTAEALSALLRDRLAGDVDVEELLNYFQLGLLEQFESATGHLDVVAAAHQAGFGSTVSGSQWVVRRSTPGDSGKPVVITDAELIDSAAATEGGGPPSGTYAALLALNTAQAERDRLDGEIAARRGQIFADWYKYLSDVWHQDGQQRALNAQAFICNEITTLEAVQARLVNAQGSVEAAAEVLGGILGADYQVMRTDAPRHWQPNEPVILLAGPDVIPPVRYGRDGRADPTDAGKLVCRVSGSTITALDAGSTRVDAQVLPSLAGGTRDGIPPEVAALVAETGFLEPRLGPTIARALHGAATPNQVQDAQRALITGHLRTDPIAFEGQVPSTVGARTWTQPWIPIQLAWELALNPTHPVAKGETSEVCYPPDAVTSVSTFDDNTLDLAFTQLPQPSSGQPYTGSAVLTGRTEINLASQLTAYVDNHPSDPNAALLRRAAAALDFPMLAQALTGLNEALVMRVQTLQLPVNDPQSRSPLLDEFSNTDVPKAVAFENRTAPKPVGWSFNPIRGGLAQLTTVRIVDAFGQFRELSAPEVVVAERLAPLPGAPAKTFAVPPRIARPTRLQCRWLPSEDSVPTSTPICGWLLFNKVDESLAVYAADGRALGALSMLGGSRWSGAPGDNATYGKKVETVLAQANRHLRDLVVHAANSGPALQDLLTVVDDAMKLTHPLSFEQDDGLSLLVGRPLALVRAGLRLEILGRAPVDQGWAAFEAAMVDPLPDPRRWNAELQAVRFPVRLGDPAHPDDGLVGYYLNEDYAVLYSHLAKKGEPTVLPPDMEHPTVCLTSDPAPDGEVAVTMLLDPRAPVRAVSGILPSTSLVLDPALFRQALARISVTFRSTPVLTVDGHFPVPAPGVGAAHAWSWVTLDPELAEPWVTTEQAWQAGARASLSGRQRAEEGWLRLSAGSPPSQVDR